MIGLAEYYHCRPSCFFTYISEYEKYCLDEACAYINSRMKNGEKPKFSSKVKGKNYKSFSEYYSELLM